MQSSMQWQEVGAWHAGTVGAVALNTFAGITRGLLASRAGVYQWQQPHASPSPLVKGLTDLHIVTVAYAGGTSGTPATALASTATGRLFRHLPSDEGWQEINTWAGLGLAVVLAPSPAYDEDGTLFVGTPQGIFRTQDDGQSWESCNFGLLDEDVLCMAVAPNFAQSDLLWAGTAGGGLYRSRNSGRAWRESGLGLPDAAVQSLAVSPNFDVDRTLFAGMEGNGLYISRDGGENWSALSLSRHSINALACSQADLLWVGTEDGLWRVATESGESIQVIGEGEVVMSAATTAAGQVAAGLFANSLLLSENGDIGSSGWQKPTLALHAPPVISRIGNTLIALDSDGLLARSSSAGATWVEMEDAYPEDVLAVAGVENRNNEISLFAVTTSGMARWVDGQGGWQDADPASITGDTLIGIELSPTFEQDQTVLVVDQENRLHLSQDGAIRWREISGAWGGQQLLRAHFAPHSASEVVALTMQPTDAGHFNMALWHSHDMGQKWEVLAGFTSGVPAVTLAWPQDGIERPIYLATQHRIIKLYYQDEPPELQLHQHFFDETVIVTALAVATNYAENGTIWAATSSGLYVSQDRGVSWMLTLDLPDELPILWLEVADTHLDAITLGGHVWRAVL